MTTVPAAPTNTIACRGDIDGTFNWKVYAAYNNPDNHLSSITFVQDYYKYVTAITVDITADEIEDIKAISGYRTYHPLACRILRAQGHMKRELIQSRIAARHYPANSHHYHGDVAYVRLDVDPDYEHIYDAGVCAFHAEAPLTLPTN